MTGKGIFGWLAGALGGLLIVALVSVLAPSPQGAGTAQSASPALAAPAFAAPAQDAAPSDKAGDAAATPAPEPQPKSADQASAPAAPASDAAPAAATEPAPRVSADQTALPTAPTVQDAPAAAASETAPVAASAPPPQMPATAEAAPGAAAATAPQVPVVQNVAPPAPASAAASADAPQSPASADAAPQVAQTGTAPAAPVSDAAPAPEPAPQHDTLLEPAPIPAAAPDAGIAPVSANAPDAPASTAAGTAPALPQVLAPSPNDAPDAAPKPGMTATFQDNKPSTLPSVGRLTDRAAESMPGVKADALPQIGKSDTGEESLPQIGQAAASAPEVKPQGPMQDFARAFTPGSPPKPLFAILLRDIGDKGMPRAELLKLPFPVSIVLDPLAPDANAAMQAWRGAGQEVVIAMGGLPVGAEASDVAQTFQALSTSLPQAVALIDASGTTFQNDRPLASLVVPEVQSAGMGLVTFDEGLDAADQIARRNGVPAAQVFRRLDAKGEGGDVIRRYLDRAAFKAAQDGAVVVLGDTSADTVAAILEWTVEGKASGVTLAPLTAVLGR